MKGIVFAVAIAVTATPAPAQTALDRLVQKIGKKSSEPTTTGGRYAAIIAPAQSAALDRAIAEPVADAGIAAARAEAAPVIRALLETGSCAQVSNAWNAVNRWHMTPKSWNEPSGTEYVPMGVMPNHDRRRCLTVVRIADWAMPADDVLVFGAFYLADDSGDARRQEFELQKASDGQWLIRDIGMGLH